MNIESLTPEELRPVLHPIAAMLSMQALIAKAPDSYGIQHDDVLLMANTAIDCASTLMACLVADSMMDAPPPETIPLAYEAGVNSAADHAIKTLREHHLYGDLPDNFKRLIGRAATAIQKDEDGIPF